MHLNKEKLTNTAGQLHLNFFMEANYYYHERIA